MKDAIGGYFPLELPQKKLKYHKGGEYFNSARAAFYALLKAGKPDAVWMPRWICDAMLSPLSELGVPVHFYSLEENFSPEADLKLAPGEWLLYVNYFGLCNCQEQALLKRFNPAQIIFDRSQAFFSPPQQGLATIYSPRKFFGVPDGGLLFSSLPVMQPELQEKVPLPPTEHMIQRLTYGAEAGFAAYQQAENLLSVLPGTAISALSQRLLETVDYPFVEKIRLRNFRYLHAQLQHLNVMSVPEELPYAPFCYPFLNRKKGLRESLYGVRIYTATFWQDAAVRLEKNDRERVLVDYLIPLPIDQRYTLADMQTIVDSILERVTHAHGDENE
ncbi:hypothetical protein [Lelliottia amnigena]|uniref:hypothetical protein n=1 Tax=Lelliottia amnigena TaxID=61646 RepID=UPI002B23BFBF|nr:hypothetical protein [Lelliottia amnigena]MEA9394222.1 hypothetical protein [Lelliottia amnigena]